MHSHAIKLERRKIWLIEQKPKDPTYCYSKREFYWDPESFYFVYQENFDRSGGLWKTEVIYYRILPNPVGGHLFDFTQCGVTDVKIWEAGPARTSGQYNVGLKADTFTLDYMRRMGR
jgi:hypothetical protein